MRKAVLTKVSNFRVPPQFDEILELLPSQVTLNVPARVLAEWFGSKPAAVLDTDMLERAKTYAQTCGCKFAFHRSIQEGLFYKLRTGAN